MSNFISLTPTDPFPEYDSKLYGVNYDPKEVIFSDDEEMVSYIVVAKSGNEENDAQITVNGEKI